MTAYKEFRARVARTAVRITFPILSVVVAACDDHATAPLVNAHAPESASLAKGAKALTPAIAFSLNGANGQNLFVIDTLGTNPVQLTDASVDDNPAWSPDRRKIAFVRGDGMDREIYIKALKGGRETRVGPGHQPSWSPDGTRLAFSRIADGNQDVYVMNVDGSDVRRLTTDAGYDSEPHWAADGQSIAFTSTRTGSSDVFVMKPDGSVQTRRTFCAPLYYCASPKFAPHVGDFRILFYQGTVSGSGAPALSAIRAIDTNGDIVMSIDGALVLGHPTWSPDAQRFAFVGQSAAQVTPVIYVAKYEGPGLNYMPVTLGAAVGSPAWAR